MNYCNPTSNPLSSPLSYTITIVLSLLFYLLLVKAFKPKFKIRYKSYIFILLALFAIQEASGVFLSFVNCTQRLVRIDHVYKFVAIGIISMLWAAIESALSYFKKS